MKVNGMKENEMDMVSLPKETVITSRVIGLMTKERVKVLTSTATKTSFSSESGLMTNPRLVFTPKLKMKMLTKAQRNHTSKILMSFHQFLN